MKATLTALATLAAFSAAPCLAQAQPAATPPAFTVGANVYDVSGGLVGTIDSVTPTAVTVSTGTNKVGLSPGSFGKSDKGPTISMTRAELDAASEKAKADAMAAFRTQIVAGAVVHGVQGQPIGTIKSVTGDTVLVTTDKGEVTLPVTAFGPGSNGILIGMTADQFDAAVAAQTKPAGGGA